MFYEMMKLVFLIYVLTFCNKVSVEKCFFFMIVQYRVLIFKYCFEYYNGILNIFLLLNFFTFWRYMGYLSSDKASK